MKSVIAFLCVMIGAVLVVTLLRQCSTDSKTASDTPSPSSSPTPSPFKSATPAPTAVASLPAVPTPQVAVDPASGLSEDSIRQIMLSADKGITYEKVKKNAEAYNRQAWAFTGRVMQIQESGGRTGALVTLDPWGNKLVWVTANFTTDFVDNSQVYVVGYLAGNYSYTSIAGWQMTIPAIAAQAILKPSEANRIKAGKKPAKQ